MKNTTYKTALTFFIHIPQEKNFYSCLHQTIINLTNRAAWLNIVCKMGEMCIPYRKEQSYCLSAAFDRL